MDATSELAILPHNSIAGEADTDFEAAACYLGARLLWLPELGMGYFPVKAAPHHVYNRDYFAKYEAMAATPMGGSITAARVSLIQRACPEALPEITDVGIGCGQFIEAYPGRAWGFDVNTAGLEWLSRRGLYRDIYREGTAALSCWDSLEHVPRPSRLIDRAAEWLFVSLPIFEGAEHVLASRHFRPDEHFWYWTDRGFRRWLDLRGFDVIEANQIETELGREDIRSYAARRRNALAPI